MATKFALEPEFTNTLCFTPNHSDHFASNSSTFGPHVKNPPDLNKSTIEFWKKDKIVNYIKHQDNIYDLFKNDIKNLRIKKRSLEIIDDIDGKIALSSLIKYFYKTKLNDKKHRLHLLL